MGARLEQYMARIATDYTVDELIPVCIARQAADGDVLALPGNRVFEAETPRRGAKGAESGVDEGHGVWREWFKRSRSG